MSVFEGVCVNIYDCQRVFYVCVCVRRRDLCNVVSEQGGIYRRGNEKSAAGKMVRSEVEDLTHRWSTVDRGGYIVVYSPREQVVGTRLLGHPQYGGPAI